MTKKNARKTAARERQAKVGGKYMTHLEPKDDRATLEKRISDAFLVLNNGLYFTGKLAPTREALFTRIQQALQVLNPTRTVLEQAGDELLSEKLDEMFGPSPSQQAERIANSSAAQTLKMASDILDKGLAREKAEAARTVPHGVMTPAPPRKRHPLAPPSEYTVNDAMFNEVVRGIYTAAPGSERHTLLTFLRWLRTSGPDAKTHGLVEAYCEAEARVDEYVKGGTAREWRVDNMGHAISADVARMLGGDLVTWERIEPSRWSPHNGQYTQWACRFKSKRHSTLDKPR